MSRKVAPVISHGKQDYQVLDRGSACLQCKRRKKRCDGAKPICGPCVRFDTAGACSYPEPSKRGKDGRSSTSGHPSKTHQLRLKIEELEVHLTSLRGALHEEQHSGEDGGPHDSPQNSMLESPYWMTSKDSDRMDEVSRHRELSPALSVHDLTPSDISHLKRNASLLATLLDVFIVNRHKCAMDVNPDRLALAIRRFIAAMITSPPGSPQSPETVSPLGQADNPLPHPGLGNAIFLLGCHFGQVYAAQTADLVGHSSSAATLTAMSLDSLARYEEYFLHETRSQLSKALTSADRLPDFVRGTALLVWYYFAKGRIAEAAYHSAGLNSFASACRLHLIDPSGFSTSDEIHFTLAGSSRIIGPPSDLIELEERISLFWQIIALDRCAAAMLSTPCVFLEGEIWTPLSRSIHLWNTPRTDGISRHSQGKNSVKCPALDVVALPAPSGQGLRSISMMLLERTMRLERRFALVGDNQTMNDYEAQDLRDEYEAILHLLKKVAAWLPPLLPILSLSSPVNSPLPSPSTIGSYGPAGNTPLLTAPFQVSSTYQTRRSPRGGVGAYQNQSQYTLLDDACLGALTIFAHSVVQAAIIRLNMVRSSPLLARAQPRHAVRDESVDGDRSSNRRDVSSLPSQAFDRPASPISLASTDSAQYADGQMLLRLGDQNASLTAAIETGNLARLVLTKLPSEILDELDMMIGLAWVAALHVIHDEIDRLQHLNSLLAMPAERGANGSQHTQMIHTQRRIQEMTGIANVLESALARLANMFQLVDVMRTSF